MKTLKYIVPVFSLIFGFNASLWAEDSIINRNVTVEREYKPLIKDAGKINSIPKALEPVVEKTAPKFSDFNFPLNAEFNIHTLAAAELQREKRPDFKGGFARLGFGNYFNSLADFAYPIIKKPDMRLDVSLNHLATFGKKAHSLTRGAFSLDKDFKTLNLYTGLGGGHEYFNYYGNNFNANNQVINLDTLAAFPNYGVETYNKPANIGIQTIRLDSLAAAPDNNYFWRFNAYAGVRSLPLAKGIQYQMELNYNLLSQGTGITEHHFVTKGGISSELKNNRAGIDFRMDNLMYRSDSLNNGYSIVTFNPYYSIQKQNLNIRIGVKSSLSFTKDTLLINPTADITAEWKVIPKYFSIYGGLTGSYDVNTMNKIFTENRYVNSYVQVENTYSPFNVYTGIKVKPIYNLLVDAYLDYKYFKNQYFFVNEQYSSGSAIIPIENLMLYSNRFNVIYDTASQLKIGMRANYNIRNRVNVELKAAINDWNLLTEQYAWNMPEWEASLNTDVHINRELSLSLNTFLEGPRYAKIGTSAIRMRPIVDINIGASYLFNNWLSGYLKINNLINNTYQNYYGYQVQGFNVLIGGAVSF